MIRCQSCGTENIDASRYCDECGTKLPAPVNSGNAANGSGSFEVRPISSGVSGSRPAQVTSVGIPPLVEKAVEADDAAVIADPRKPKGTHARLIIERGESVNTEFQLSAEESYIGRWDADNGIFPDIDLDTHDPDAKVSRRHARITYRAHVHMVEDLGSTNGTFVNRGRRLLPGSPQVLSEGDEIIVGKTFLRFHINR
ncbi:MAG: FHA domain-containing protein [Pyrinomonadaceae bacterium]